MKLIYMNIILYFHSNFTLDFYLLIARMQKFVKWIGIVKGGGGYGYLFHNFMKNFIFMLAHVLLLHDLYNLFGDDVVGFLLL